jgi:hypothetical protein
VLNRPDSKSTARESVRVQVSSPVKHGSFGKQPHGRIERYPASFNNIQALHRCKNQVPLTTISQPIFDRGRIAAMELLDMLTGNSAAPRRHIIQPKLVERESTELFNNFSY